MSHYTHPMLASSLQLVLGVVAFSSSLQLGLSLGHQPLSPVETGAAARDHGRVMLATSICGFARRRRDVPRSRRQILDVGNRFRIAKADSELLDSQMGFTRSVL
jgi:hypothetical protein